MADDKLDNDILADAQSMETEAPEELITSDIDAELDAELEAEEKYGDSGLRTFAESAASSATFGLSDQALTKSGLVSQEDLRERRERNSKSAIAGEIAGIAGPALLSGGTSLAAKGAAAGVTTAAKAGLVTEKLTAKAISKILAETGKKSLAKEVLRKGIAKGAGSAVEGSFYGVGKLISEEALGNADFNAENLITHAGTAALFGGALGGALGTVTAAVPVIKGGKITGWTTKKFKGTIDPAKNAQQLAGVTPTQLHKLKTFNPKVYAHTPKMLKEIATKEGVGSFSSNTKLFGATKKFIDDTGVAIGKTLDDATAILEAKAALPTRQQVASRITNSLKELTKQFKDDSGKILSGQKPKVNKILRVMKDFDDDLISTEVMSAQAVNKLKGKYQKLSKWDLKGNLPLEDAINRDISGSLREEVGVLAKKAGGELGAKLEKELLDYQTASKFIENFAKKIDTQSVVSFGSVRDIMVGGMFGVTGKILAATNAFAQTDLKKRLSILVGVEKANKAVTKTVSNKVVNFINGTKKAVIPVTTKSLTNSQLSKKYEDGSFTKKPKDNKEAFKNISSNLSTLSSDPDQLLDVTNTSNMDEAAPLAANHTRTLAVSAIQFLFSKLPKDSRNSGVLSSLTRPYEPSSIELSKFEKYVRAVENPLTILDDLESGTVTREAVEAIKTVYPNLYARIQEKTMDEIAKNPDSVTYEKRLSLGILLDLPTDAALEPSNIKGLQMNFQEAQQSQSGGTITAGGAAKLDMAQSEASEVQKVSNRRDLDK